METRILGRTGLEVSILGLGGHTYPVGDGPNDFKTPEQRAQMVKYLVDNGVNYFDTTWKNEVELLADSFKRAQIKTDSVIISSQYVDAISNSNWRCHLQNEMELRLQILGLSKLPLFIMGVGNAEVTFDELVYSCEEMTKLKQQGLVKHIGISCHRLEYFPLLTKLIEETNLIDYMMIKFNWKFQQANELLFKAAKNNNVGVVLMKVFCWDCGPNQWNRRISVFEPIGEIEESTLTPAQRSFIWSVQNSPCATTAVSMNSCEEAKENLLAVQALNEKVDTDDFLSYSNRLWNESELNQLALYASSQIIRERAEQVLKDMKKS